MSEEEAKKVLSESKTALTSKDLKEKGFSIATIACLERDYSKRIGAVIEEYGVKKPYGCNPNMRLFASSKEQYDNWVRENCGKNNPFFKNQVKQ